MSKGEFTSSLITFVGLSFRANTVCANSNKFICVNKTKCIYAYWKCKRTWAFKQMNVSIINRLQIAETKYFY